MLLKLIAKSPNSCQYPLINYPAAILSSFFGVTVQPSDTVMLLLVPSTWPCCHRYHAASIPILAAFILIAPATASLRRPAASVMLLLVLVHRLVFTVKYHDASIPIFICVMFYTKYPYCLPAPICALSNIWKLEQIHW